MGSREINMGKKINQNCQFRITVDQGGTFADGVLVDHNQEISVAKAGTSPDDPAQGIMDCIQLPLLPLLRKQGR